VEISLPQVLTEF